MSRVRGLATPGEVRLDWRSGAPRTPSYPSLTPASMPIRLVATDIDGTLLRDDLSVSPRTRDALDAARAAGIQVVPVTARQPIGLRQIAEEAGFDEWAVCSNGALGVNLTSGEVLFEQTVEVAVQRRLASALETLVDGLLFVSVRDAGEGFVPQEGYTAIATDHDHKRDVVTMGSHTLEEVLAEPSLKLIVRGTRTIRSTSSSTSSAGQG